MARSTSSVPRRSKQSSTLPEGTTPRPPRRRKQPTTTSKTPAVAQQRLATMDDDDEFSFAASSTSTAAEAVRPPSDNIGIGAKSGKSSGRSSASTNRKGSSSRIGEKAAAGEKENAVNESSNSAGRKEPKTATREGDAPGRDKRVGKRSANVKAKSKSKMEELNDSMAQVNLGNKTDIEDTAIAFLEREAGHKTNPFPPKGFGAKNIALSTTEDGKSKYILQHAVQIVEKSGENEAVCKLFQTPSMVDAMASASFSLGPAESILLEENSPKLLDTAKRCLKSLSSFTSASGSSSKKSDPNKANDELETALLRVAVYSLRSILPTLLESSKSQSTCHQVVIKLLYHCVVIAGDACHRKFQSFTEDNASSSSSSASTSLSKKDGSHVMADAMICLGAFEGLGKCLQSGKKKSSKSSSKRGAVSWDEMLPLPEGTANQTKSVSKVLPHRQLVKIAMESSLCASSSFLYLSLMSLHAHARSNNKKWSVPNEFHFASSVIFEACSGEYEETATFQKIMSKVALPYMMQSVFMVEEGDESSTFSIDALRHVKKAFRILWDGSRSVEDVCNVKNASALRMCCLDLQSEAILFILRTLRGVFQLFPDLLREVTASGLKELNALFDRACSSAMKSAGMFEKVTSCIFKSSAEKSTCDDDSSMRRKKRALLVFHDVVGDELDGVAIFLCPEKSVGEKKKIPLLPTSYYEFCVYRSIHWWQLVGSVEMKHSQLSLSLEKRRQICSEEVGMSTFSIVHMVLQARHSLKNDAVPLKITDSDCERTISHFEHMVINSSLPASLSRCRSLLMLLDLQREASKIMTSSQSGHTPYSGKGSCIAVLALVLGRCLASLEAKLALATKEQSRSLNSRLSAADLRTKSAALLDVAVENSVPDKVRDKYTVEADLQLRKSYEILLNELGRLEKDSVDRKASPVLAIENFAKTATFVARWRSDRKEVLASLQTQMLVAEILAKVAIKAPNKDLFNAYQLPNRFVNLSAALEINSSTAESCAALAMAAWCTIETMSAQSSAKSKLDTNEVAGDSTSEEILLFPESTFMGIRSQTDVQTSGLSPIIKRLCRNLLKEESQDNCITHAGDSLARSLEHTLMGKVLEAACMPTSSNSDNLMMQIRLSKLLHCAVWNQKRYEEELCTAQIADIVRDILKSAIRATKSNLADEEHKSLLPSLHLFEELKIFLQTQEKRLGNFIDSDVLQVLSSSFHVSFAAHLVDSRLLCFPRPTSWVLGSDTINKRQHKLLEHSCSQLQLAEKQFAAASIDERSVHDVCFFAQWSAVQLHYAILFEHLYLAKSSQETCVIDASSVASKQTPSVLAKYALALSSASLAIDQMGESSEEVFSQVVESLLSTLKRLLCWFSCHSDPISATGCFILLQKVYSLVEQPLSFIGAISSFLSVSSKFEDLARTLTSHTLSHDHSCFSSELGLQCVVDAVDMTFGIIDKSHITSPESESILCQLLASVEVEAEILSENTEDKEAISTDMFSETDRIIQKQSFVTTILMLLAKLSVDSGKAASAVKYLGWCRIQCKQLVRFLRSASRRLNHVFLDDMTVQVNDMLTMCYERLAIAFCQLGIRRKAEDHAMWAVMKQKTLDIDGQSFTQINMQHLIDSIERYGGHECFLHPIRSLMRVKALSTSADKMATQQILLENVGLRLSDRRASINHILCHAKNILAYNYALRHSPGFSKKAHLYIDRVYKELNRCVSEDRDALVPLVYFTRRAGFELKLRMVRDRVCDLNELIDLKFGSGMGNAEAYYRLGLIALSKARDDGELQVLWKDHAGEEEECDYSAFNGCNSHLPHTLEAKKFFENALTNAPSASFNLTKNILRSLALVTGPKAGQPQPGLMAASMINMSVGGSARNIVRDSLNEGKVRDSFKVFDDELLDHKSRVQAVGLLLMDSAALIPINWNTSTLATCPTGEILISSLRVSINSCGEKFVDISTTCIFPASNVSESGIHTDVLIPLDRIIERSQRQLHGITEDVQNEQYNEELSRRKWWNERHSIDKDLQSLLKYTEQTYFSHCQVRQRILPDQLFNKERENSTCFDDGSSECSELGPGNLASRFEAAGREPPESILDQQEFDGAAERSNLTKLTVAVIKKKLASFDVTNVKKLRKAELIDLLLSEIENSCSSDNIEDATSIEGTHEHSAMTKTANDPPEYPCEVDQTPEPCTILVLDEHLLRFPFESMDMFSDITITRVPSLPFVLATLLETESLHSTSKPKVDARKVKCVLDPESNLSESASTLGPALNSIASKNGWEWEGVVGQLPSSEFMSQALAEENGLYLYCGHGGGEKVMTRSQVEELMTGRDDGMRGCRSAIVLMGCSSGKLQSVNTPKENPSGRVHTMHYEPEGIALSYLFAGAPCVVGNLWDVTDRDIDRYCLTLMEDFVQIQGDIFSPRSFPSLAKCVANARKACKLRYIVGSAPVCYGVPVYNVKST
ncbi:hypothetical protein ACHAXR_011062 [Thalassiosira sp. AJA248-18]